MSDLEKKLLGLELGRPVAVTVGTFDGVHLGHRRLLEVLRNEAGQAELASVAVTFEKQPRSLIDPNADVTYLATLDHRIELLRETGVDAVLPVRFDDHLREQSADQFLALLNKAAGAELLIFGEGARLGHDRLTATELRPLADERGIRIVEVPAVNIPTGVVSSSAIRKALFAGEVKVATQMLGRQYRIAGTVVKGDQRGRELGFPTANIEPAEHLAVPANGIYATVISIAGQRHMAATSVGVRPTFGGGERLTEAYILDFEGDLYGQSIELEFVERLRGEVKFDGVEPLISQMKLDVSETRAVLSGAL